MKAGLHSPLYLPSFSCFRTGTLNPRKHAFVAIGLAHSVDTLKLLQEILQDSGFGFGAEGTMMSGYELCVFPTKVQEAVDLIRKHPKVHIEGHSVTFYERARFLDDGTRYDRLLDHDSGRDPGRPSVNGVSFKL